MSILEGPLIRGVKSAKATYNDICFQKNKPLGPHNFPLSKFTTMRIFGYKKDRITGIKRPYWLDKTFPTGAEITPQKCGLDGFYDIKPVNQII
jgi:hypothetical protein